MKQIERKLIINNGFWSVFQTFFETNGKKGNVLTMEGSNNQKAIFIFPLTKEKEVIYLNEYRFGPSKIMKMFPAGGIGKSQTTKKAAERELLEETGYKAREIFFLGSYIHNGYITGSIDLYLGIDCERVGEQKLEDIEEIEVLKSSIEDFDSMIKNNEIQCPWTEVAFMRAKEKTNNFTEFF